MLVVSAKRPNANVSLMSNLSDFLEKLAILSPGWIFMMASAAPALIGLVLALMKLRQKRLRPFLAFWGASTAASSVALLILWGFLVGDDLSSSSTAGLIFLFVPGIAAIAMLAGGGIGVFAANQFKVPEPGLPDPASPLPSRIAMLILIPAALTLWLSGLITAYVLTTGDMKVAERSTSLATLRDLNAKALAGTADPFGVPLFLGQNPNTPADVLETLSHHPHAAVRGFVDRHPNSSPTARARALDCPPVNPCRKP